MEWPEQSEHPYVPSEFETGDIANGEFLLADVYRALRESPQWNETLLIVSYDEHGGTLYCELCVFLKTRSKFENLTFNRLNLKILLSNILFIQKDCTIMFHLQKQEFQIQMEESQLTLHLISTDLDSEFHLS